MKQFIVTEEERKSIRNMYLMEQTSVKQRLTEGQSEIGTVTINIPYTLVNGKPVLNTQGLRCYFVIDGLNLNSAPTNPTPTLDEWMPRASLRIDTKTNNEVKFTDLVLTKTNNSQSQIGYKGNVILVEEDLKMLGLNAQTVVSFNNGKLMTQKPKVQMFMTIRKTNESHLIFANVKTIANPTKP